MTAAITTGLGMAVLGFGGRVVLRQMPRMHQSLRPIWPNLSVLNRQTWANAKYYKGGFEVQMSRSEAALILGVSPRAPLKKIKECHKRVMLLNHPDRGGSPCIAAKINAAKDILDKAGRSF
ncbi:hypothetical protein TCAL_00463 [Tigriopus californicus]|uniref:J domain-containing protein n=1 Tax=Tigriopus californicus TaxID=6832 RepID=A0A553NDB3_TIGCA|nr:mitochondrial import inner membrane translocase subunit TIM14-like [Tigriopus californicus]TRY63405.1 hypothetical protein TCAL_00463 [Tigriopus californicus]